MDEREWIGWTISQTSDLTWQWNRTPSLKGEYGRKKELALKLPD